MIVAKGKRTRAISRDELDELISRYDDVLVDLGTGDGRFALAHARAHPRTFVIGLDPVASTLASPSVAAARKPARGGLENVLFAVARVEDLPPELDHIADKITVILPWGSLIRGVLRGDTDVVAALARVGRPGTEVRIVLNNEIYEDPVPLDAVDLPKATVSYANSTLRPRFAAGGIDLEDSRILTQEEVRALRSTWSRKLAHGRAPEFLELRGTVC